jgi:hypothetical protein
MSVTEAASGVTSQMGASLLEGLRTISQNQTIPFTLYKELRNAHDGFIFWVRADLITPTPADPITIDVMGSLHYDSNQGQQEDETIAVQRVVFTTDVEIAPFNDIESTTIYIGSFEGFEFSFTARQMYYQQSGLYHYYGDAVYPAMQTQLIKTVEQLADVSQVVSNSLPIWLTLNAIMPMYPSYLVPTNLPPPYAVVHVNQSSQKALQAYPYLDSTSTHWHLLTENVKIVVYGLRNDKALDYLDYIIQSADDTTFGLMNLPIVQDEKRTQSELNILGMKKVIRFDISYYQHVARNIARQLILSSVPTYVDANLFIYDSTGSQLYDSAGSPLLAA